MKAINRFGILDPGMLWLKMSFNILYQAELFLGMIFTVGEERLPGGRENFIFP
jgi:hypothetical protein